MVNSSLISGVQARLGLTLVLSSMGVLSYFTRHINVISDVMTRCLLGEAVVQAVLAFTLRPSSTLLTPYHLLLTASATGLLLVQFPLEAGLSGEALLVFASVVCFPLGLSVLWQGVVVSQLGYHMSSSYWTFQFESPSRLLEGDVPGAAPEAGSAAGVAAAPSLANNFALMYQSPASVIAVLRATQVMVQMIEIGGLDESERMLLTQARNHFLYRVRNSSSFRHKAIAAELLFRVVAELLMKRTASRMVEPANGTLSFLEKRFSSRLLDQSESFIKPLPAPLDPDSTAKWVLVMAVSLLAHKRLFKAIKGAQGGDLHASAQAAKYLSRFAILVYLTARFLITQTKRNNSTMGDGADASNLPPLMFN